MKLSTVTQIIAALVGVSGIVHQALEISDARSDEIRCVVAFTDYVGVEAQAERAASRAIPSYRQN